jgi:acetylornithine deacetylase/succinyl-diaminopimelate desuccinylase-like protein
MMRSPRRLIVYANWLGAPGPPTIAFYGHYNVQPPDSLDQWQIPPFEPIMRGDDLFGRGASDDKVQMFVHVKALELYLRTNARLPIAVQYLFEGEEEIGSPLLAGLLECHTEALTADIAVVSDTHLLVRHDAQL